MNKNLSSCKFCKEKFAKQYLHLHLYWVGQVIRCFTFCQKVCLMVGQVIRCKTLLITWPTISQKRRSGYAPPRLHPSLELYLRLIFGRNALIWGYFQNVWQCRFWGHECQRMFEVGFWDFDPKMFLAKSESFHASLKNVI
jgi:hypothetical protein